MKELKVWYERISVAVSKERKREVGETRLEIEANRTLEFDDSSKRIDSAMEAWVWEGLLLWRR